ncbi:DM9 repeat-containing protein [Oligoflexus tunisiensis]|uniref:DM9 repeat-containing protein n=1 Tax=Oligoflexus tunisiensis TaxID=708132 RepID=UPI00114CBBDA|nr:DM9 repeat-containing protein [Oligoflexus tunisiensis]
MRCKISIFLTLWLAGLACTEAKLDSGPVAPGQTMDKGILLDPQAIESSDAEAKAASTDDERVAPPSNIAGAYLICAETQAATAELPESNVNCALKDPMTHNKVSLASYQSYSWNYQVPAGSNLVVTMSQLPRDPDWHVQFLIKGPALADIQNQMGQLMFTLDLQTAEGVSSQQTSTVKPQLVSWLSLAGASAPAAAARGGTEHTTNPLWICRIYHENEIIPAKLIVHFNNPQATSCYGTYNGASVGSQSSDALTVLAKSEVLLINQGTFDEYLEWVPAANGEKPARAFVTGIDAAGAPLYSCRGNQDGTDIIPGVLRPGANGCVHEWYGAAERTTYEVLAWKRSVPL